MHVSAPIVPGPELLYVHNGHVYAGHDFAWLVLLVSAIWVFGSFLIRWLS